MPTEGFELPNIPASERLQTHALDRVATGIAVFCNTGNHKYYYISIRPMTGLSQTTKVCCNGGNTLTTGTRLVTPHQSTITAATG
jgi:hypothetical protein